MSKITIITATKYLIRNNRQEHFEQMFKSVHSQTHQDIEHLIINNKTNDGTEELIHSLIAKYSTTAKTHVISESDNGIYNAFNIGISKATGEYIIFMNSDDYFYTEKALEILVTKAQEKNTKITYAKHVAKFLDDDFHISSTKIEDLLIYNPICQQTILYKKSVFDEYGLFNEDYKIVADYEYTLKLLLAGCTFAYIPQPLAHYRLGGVSTNNINASVQEIAKIQKKLIFTDDYFTEDKLYKFYRNKICSLYFIWKFSQLKLNIPDKIRSTTIRYMFYSWANSTIRCRWLIRPIENWLRKHKNK